MGDAPPLPPYVEHGGPFVDAQPYRIEGARFYGFLLRAEFKTLARYVDDVLNAPARGAVTYQPLADRVMLGLLDAASIVIGPEGAPRYSVPELDLAFWVPVVSVRKLGPIEFATRFAWHLAYVTVDKSWAMSAGREVYGFPKGLGRFDLSRTDGTDGLAPGFVTEARVRTLAVDRFGPEALAEVRDFLTIRRTAAPPAGPLARSWTDLREAAEDFFSVLAGGHKVALPGWGLVRELADLVTHHEYPMVFLKQFRDHADPTRACYQEVVEAPVTITAFRHAGRLAGDYEVAIRPLASHPVVERLGLDGPNPDVLESFYLDFDFTMGDGRSVAGSASDGRAGGQSTGGM